MHVWDIEILSCHLLYILTEARVLFETVKGFSCFLYIATVLICLAVN